MRLVYEGTNDEVQIGDEVTLKGGRSVTVKYFREPHKPSSSGKVSVESFDGYQMEYFVGVIGAKWIEREDHAENH